jgi:hypothetical protein
VELDNLASLIFLFSSSRLIFVDGGSINSNVFDWRDATFSLRNRRTSAKLRLRSIWIRTGVEISGKRRRSVVDDDEVFNRFSASCSRRFVSVVPDPVSRGEAIDDLNGAWLDSGKPTVRPAPPNGLNPGATRLYSSPRWSSKRTWNRIF